MIGNNRDTNTLHPTVKRGHDELKRRMKEKGYDMQVNETYRDNEYQNMLYNKRPKVTNAKGGESMHNYRLAFDIYKNAAGQEWSDIVFFDTAGKIWEEMGGEWGGSWDGFVDKPHFQFTNGLTIKQLQQGQTVPQNAKMNWEKNEKNASGQVKPANNYTHKVVNVTSTLNVRSGAGHDFPVVATLKNNDLIAVTEVKGEWAKTAMGWVSSSYIAKL